MTSHLRQRSGVWPCFIACREIGFGRWEKIESGTATETENGVILRSICSNESMGEQVGLVWFELNHTVRISVCIQVDGGIVHYPRDRLMSQSVQ